MAKITYTVIVTVDEDPKPSDVHEIMVGIRTALNIGKSEGIITRDSELLVERIEVEGPSTEQGPAKTVTDNGILFMDEIPRVDDKTADLIKRTLDHVENMNKLPEINPEDFNGLPTPEGWAKAGEVAKDMQFQGYHKFRNHETGEEYGSFEVHHVDKEIPTADEPIQPGWYWRSCFPGCLPDGDDSGPFPTAEGAYLDAIGE